MALKTYENLLIFNHNKKPTIFYCIDGPMSKHIYQSDGPKCKNMLTLLAGL